MKNKLTIVAATIAALASLTASVQAVQITGSVTFGGTVFLNSGSTVSGATAVTGWAGINGVGTPFTLSSSGALAAAGFSPVTFTAPWTFGSGKTALWSYVGLNGDTYTFNLLASTPAVFSGSPVTLSSTGSGTITATGPVPFDPTSGTWAFSTQDPSAGTPAAFSFSAASGAVPDGGMTVMLLGAALSGLFLVRKQVLS